MKKSFQNSLWYAVICHLKFVTILSQSHVKYFPQLCTHICTLVKIVPTPSRVFLDV